MGHMPCNCTDICRRPGSSICRRRGRPNSLSLDMKFDLGRRREQEELRKLLGDLDPFNIKEWDLMTTPATAAPKAPSCHPNDLSALAYANGFTLWHYRAHHDAMAHVMTPGYFDKVANMLRVGDIVMINAEHGGETVTGLRAVAGNQGGRVTLALLV